MKTVHGQRNVALMAQQFQNLVHLGHDTPPPPPQSQPPADEVIDSSAFITERTVSSGTHREMLSNLSQGHQHLRQYDPNEHLAQLMFHHQQQQQQQQQQQPMLEPLLDQHHQLDLAENENFHLVGPQMNQAGEKLTGIARLLNDLHRLWEDHESADIVFLVGSNELPVYAHRAILRARCRTLQNVKPGELYKIFTVTGSSVNRNEDSVIRWPQAQPDVLRDVLYYVYTGKIIVQEKKIFEALAIGSELGLDELVLIYEEHINASINIHNACQHLDAAICLQQRLSENDWNRIVQMCMRFISENAADCVKSQTFMDLSKQGITHLVSSDYFSLDEADVFRCALAWAKHQTGVLKSTKHWNEEERSRVSQKLSGVINHIRILLIDSQVFAEEVEPTGVVPIELSLERYRFAALAANKQEHGSIKRVQPRLAPFIKQLFANSKLLSDDASGEREEILNAWYGVPKQPWKLIFRASSHDFSAEAFHHHCDGIAPTYVLILSSQGYLSGGFSDVPWSRCDGKVRGRYASSEKAFLFTLHSPDASMPTPVRYDLKKKMFAIAHHANFGPVFGAGADLSIAHHCHMNDASYSNLPHSYDGENASSSSLFGDYNFTVIDYEVFTLAD